LGIQSFTTMPGWNFIFCLLTAFPLCISICF
jgi:hypothetical protein